MSSSHSSPSSSTDQSQSPKTECEQRYWLDLPRDVMAEILLKLGAIEIITSAQYVCTSWRSISMDPTMWKSIDMQDIGDDLRDMIYDVEFLCRHVIDRSHGALVDINIKHFGSDDLLKYIANSTSHLRRLGLCWCDNVSDEGLCEVAKKLPLLEELDISIANVTKHSLEVIGQKCPHMKSLKFNIKGYIYPHVESDEVAFAIANNMPKLRHLQLLGCKLTNVGLCAILNGCPHLESLDLRQCFNINLEGPLAKRCEHIKDLRRPNDPTNDYPFETTLWDYFDDFWSSDDDYDGLLDDVILWDWDDDSDDSDDRMGF